MTAAVTIRIQQADFDIAQRDRGAHQGRDRYRRGRQLLRHLPRQRRRRAIAALTLEHYPGMAEAEIARHAETAMSRWPLTGLTVIHRVGRIAPGENIVLVLTASQHRQAAFEAAEFLMDYLKANAPFWKREESAERRPAGSRRATTTTPPPRAGPNPDGETRKAGRQKRGRAASKLPKVASGELLTLLDFVRYAVSRFVEAKLVFAHGTTDPVAEAAFLVCETPASASRPVRDLRHRARHRCRGQDRSSI